MTTKQMLLSTLILGTTINIALAMEKNSNQSYGFANRRSSMFESDSDDSSVSCKSGRDENDDIDILDTALHKVIASSSHNDKATEIAAALIKKNADINAQNKHGYTPAHLAVFCCNRPMLELLVRNGANLNLKDKYGNTPLTARSTLTVIDPDKYKAAYEDTNNFL